VSWKEIPGERGCAASKDIASVGTLTNSDAIGQGKVMAWESRRDLGRRLSRSLFLVAGSLFGD
jgi:hypothetical protein